MRIAVPKEITPDETRVALVPADVARLHKAGFEIAVQAGAGIASGAADSDYTEKGAFIEADVAKLLGESDIVAKINAPAECPGNGGHEIDTMKEGSILIANLGALGGGVDEGLAEKLCQRKISALSLDCVPRITRAQSMDILSSQATISGYKAVLIAAELLPKMMPKLTTAAGSISPARVLIIGAGVAGLQAIATAKRLGAIVEAFDTRPVVKEQVLSLGAKFVEIDLGKADAEDKGGYAKSLTEDQQRKQKEALAAHVAQSDIVITTALVPGRKAPIIVTAAMVESMRDGSIIVDLAAERGGNCELTEPGQVVQKSGVTICGRLNLPGTIPVHASQMFSRNVSTLLLDLWKDKELKLDPEDEIVAGALITRDGQVVHEQSRQRMTAQGSS